MWFFALGARFSGLNMDPYLGAGLAKVDFGTEFRGQSDGGWVGSVEDAILKGHRYAEKRNYIAMQKKEINYEHQL
jgi:hypothetical protein